MSTIAHLCDVIALLRKAPRTLQELTAVTGRNCDRIVEHLHAEGHAYIVGTRTTGKRRARVYAWQESLFACPDSDKPTDAGLVAHVIALAA